MLTLSTKIQIKSNLSNDLGIGFNLFDGPSIFEPRPSKLILKSFFINIDTKLERLGLSCRGPNQQDKRWQSKCDQFEMEQRPRKRTRCCFFSDHEAARGPPKQHETVQPAEGVRGAGLDRLGGLGPDQLEGLPRVHLRRGHHRRREGHRRGDRVPETTGDAAGRHATQDRRQVVANCAFSRHFLTSLRWLIVFF